MDHYRSSVRVTATTGDVATGLVRRQRFAIGRPLHFDAEYPHVTSLEYALGAVGAEAVNGLRAMAKRRRMAVDGVEAVVHGDLANPLAYFDVVGVDGEPELRKIDVTLYVSSPAGAPAVQQLWNDTRQKLPLIRVFAAAGLLEVTLSLV